MPAAVALLALAAALLAREAGAQGTEVPAGAATASSFGELAALVEQPDGPDVIYVTQGLAWQAANEGRGVRVSRSVSIVGACMDDNSPLPGAVAGTCTFDASWQSRFFELDGFASGVSASVAFTRIGFAKGKYLGRGGAVYVSQQQGSHKVEFTDCVFADCEANHGGAVYALGGQALDQGVVALAFLRCRLQENLAFAPADQMGAGWGGAVMARNAAVRLTFEECAFADNTATFRGGAVYVWLNAHASFKRCAFRRNRAVCAGPSCDGQSADALTWMGGAIVVDIATVSIDSTPFVENAALHGSNIHLFGPAEDKQATVNILASPSAWGDNASQGATTTFKPGAITLWGDFAFVTALALPPPPPPLPPPASSSPQLPAATASVPLPAQDDGNGSGFFDRDPAMVYLVLAAILAFALSAILATRQLLQKLRSGAQGNGTAETTGVELLPLPPRGTASLQGVQVQADGRQEAGPSRARGEVGANGGEVQAPITERFATDESTTANTEGTVSLGAMRMSIPGGAQNDASDSKSNSDGSKGTSGKGGAEHAAGPEPIEDRLASWMVSDPDLPDAPGPRLGNGSFATVFHVTWNSEVCALKVIEYHQNLAEPRQPYILSRLTSAERRREAARNELMVAKILAGETCSNLVHTLASRRHTSQSGIVQQALVQEYCEGQSLGHCLRSGSMYGDLMHSASLQQLRQLRLCRQIANGLNFLHSRGILHLDIKAANVLLRSEGEIKGPHPSSLAHPLLPPWYTAKIGDFGLAVIVPTGKTSVDVGMRGTLTHMAPELLVTDSQARLASAASDMYAFGTLIWEVVHEQAPCRGMDARTICAKTLAGEVPEFDPHRVVHWKLRSIAENAWQRLPHDRITLEDTNGRIDAAWSEVAEHLNHVAESNEDANQPIDVALASKRKRGGSDPF